VSEETEETEPEATSGPPSWLLKLAAAASEMEIGPLALPPDGSGRPSAVLILIASDKTSEGEGASDSEVASDPDLLLIQRSDGLRLHPGQPAFPGGAIDPGDDGPVAAALREAVEETGLDPAGVEVLATLPELFIPRTGFRVVPVLAWWRRPSAVAPVDIAEVAAVERVKLADLADPAVRLMIRVPTGQESPAFRVSGLLIWGFTAAVVDQLLELGGWARPWDTSVVEDLP
jgi:8-oxo-dGTP pyrophosphatase MutT (NUDIX family)